MTPPKGAPGRHLGKDGAVGSGNDPVEEWGEESFPASDAATGWQGPEEYAVDRLEHREGDQVGFVTYRVDGDRLVILHTEVPDTMGHRGVGSDLIERVVELAKQRSLVVVPRCPFARHWLSAHPDVADTVEVAWPG